MTLTRASRVWSVALFIILTTALVFFGGNQRLAHADTRGDARSDVRSDRELKPDEDLINLAPTIICRVFTSLNLSGDPLPFLDPGGLCPRDPQCSDGIDNDGDGFTDSADASCHLDFDATNPSSYEPNIDDESFEPSVLPQCSDGIDNDGDGFTDIGDPNCHTDGDATNDASYLASDNIEAGAMPICFNGIDDDGDGLIDLDDPGCESAIDDDETDPISSGQCSDGIDNDSDGFTDTDDPNCHTDGDPTNPDSYDPDGDEDGSLPVCWNGLDDDGDGLTDLDDPGCESATDDDETDSATAPQCSDGIDNDGDGLIDLDDPGCSSVGDDDETDPVAPQCSDGIDNDGDGHIDSDDPGCSDDDDDDETDPSNGGGNTAPTGGGGTPSSGGVGGGTILGLYGAVGGSVGTILDEPLIACDAYLTEFIRFGNNNNSEQVRRLQLVLRDFEGSNVPIDGVYGQSTLNAVHAFQTKYASDILTPWGVNQSTGYVYLTTRKKVNEVYCKGTKQFPLTELERSIIERTKSIVESVTQAVGGQQVDETAPAPDEITSPDVPSTTLPDITDLLDKIGSSKDDSSQTALAVDALENGTSTSEDEETESFWIKLFRVLRRGLSPQE